METPRLAPHGSWTWSNERVFLRQIRICSTFLVINRAKWPSAWLYNFREALHLTGLITLARSACKRKNMTSGSALASRILSGKGTQPELFRSNPRTEWGNHLEGWTGCWTSWFRRQPQTGFHTGVLPVPRVVFTIQCQTKTKPKPEASLITRGIVYGMLWAGFVRKILIFHQILVALKSWKMPYRTNTCLKPSNSFWKKSGKHLTTKNMAKMHPANSQL